MAEAAICLPFFVFLWMGLAALHGLWTARLTAQAGAHAMAYEGTGKGQCDGLAQPRASGADALDWELSSQAGSALEAGGDHLFDWSSYLVKATVRAEPIPDALGGPSKTLEGRARLLCNTEPQQSLGEFIFEVISSWVS
jgi:hypothetical protein